MSQDERTGYRSGDPKFRPPPPPRSAPTGGPHPAEEKGKIPADPVPHCDLCGAPMLDRNCKLVCIGCGYQRDCSDP